MPVTSVLAGLAREARPAAALHPAVWQQAAGLFLALAGTPQAPVPVSEIIKVQLRNTYF